MHPSRRRQPDSKLSLNRLAPWTLLFCVLGSEALAADELITPFVVGGEETGSAPPWMALVEVPVSSTSATACGGTLVDVLTETGNEKWVMTAAHCLLNLGSATRPVASAGDIRVYFDLTDAGNRNPQQSVAISSLIIHPDYRDREGDFAFDLALLRPANQNAVGSRQTIALAPINQSENPDPMLETEVIGYGLDNPNASGSFGILRQATVDLVARDLCNMRWGGNRIVPEMICARGTDPVREACTGDSGGPLFADHSAGAVQLGIVSFGTRSCGLESNAPGVYTNVNLFTNWISEGGDPEPQDPIALAADDFLQVRSCTANNLDLIYNGFGRRVFTPIVRTTPGVNIAPALISSNDGGAAMTFTPPENSPETFDLTVTVFDNHGRIERRTIEVLVQAGDCSTTGGVARGGGGAGMGWPWLLLIMLGLADRLRRQGNTRHAA